MENEFTNEKELEDMTDEEQEQELKESYKNIRKIEILERLPLVKWTKNELLDMLINFDLLKLAKTLKSIDLDEFIKNGEYKHIEIDFEEYKIMEETEEMKNEFLNEIKELRPCATLKNLPFAEWTRLELLDLLTEYNLYTFTSKFVGKNIRKIPPIIVYAGAKYNGLGRNYLQQVIKKV